MIKGKAKVSPKVKTKERVSLRLGQTIHTTRVLGTISLGISSLGINKTPMTPRAKGKARKVKTKVKVKVIKVKVAKLPMLSLILGLKSSNQQQHLVTNLNQKSLRCLPWKTLCRLSLKLKRNHLVVVEVQGELHSMQAPSRSTVTRSAMVMAQCALASASGSNKELFSKMIAQAESAVKDAQDKGLQANQALKERQEALDKLKKEAAQHQKEAKEAMAKVRAEGRAASAPAVPSRRLQTDLDAGVHARAAWKAEKSRQRVASHRAATAKDRTASFKNYELATHGQAKPDKWDKEDTGDLPEPPKARKLEPKRHRGGHHRSERRRADEARKKANEDKMKEMSKEGIPQWIHDKFEISSEETTDEDEFVSRLEKLKNDPEVLSKLDNVLKEAYEKA